MALPLARAGGTVARVKLCEIKIEIPADAADAADDVLLELGVAEWTLLQDAVARRAWVVGIFADEAEARARWAELARLLVEADVGPPSSAVATLWRDKPGFGAASATSVSAEREAVLPLVPVVRALADQDWRDS